MIADDWEAEQTFTNQLLPNWIMPACGHSIWVNFLRWISPVSWD